MADKEEMKEKEQISAVSLKLPPPWMNDMEMWLHVVESQFVTRGITKELTKFHYVVGALTPDLASRLRKIIFKPPDTDPYKALKAEILKQTTLTERQRYAALMRDIDLGDGRPSQLLQRLQAVAGELISDHGFLQQIFVEKLPPMVQAVLAAAPSSSTLQELADLADKIAEAYAVPPSVSVVQRPSNAAPSADVLEQLIRTQSEMQEELRALRLELRSRNSSRGRSTSRGRRSSSKRSSSADDSDYGLCWYHRVWGDRAERCREPCKWSGNGPARE
jgi:hypothetical protein